MAGSLYKWSKEWKTIGEGYLSSFYFSILKISSVSSAHNILMFHVKTQNTFKESIISSA